jgi:HEAT repeat protein
MNQTIKRVAWIAAGLGALLALAFMGWKLSAPSLDDLLALDSPTPQQIRQIAVKGLVHPDLAIRARATEKLAALGDRAKPVLSELAAESGDSDVRYAALSVLRGMDAAAAAQVMSKMVKDGAVETRIQAVNLAAGMPDPGAAGVLEKALDDPDVSVRSAAAASLDPRSSPAAAAKLRAALKDPDYNVQRHAARQLRKLELPN